ncbi:FRG domain-containing protein [Paraburkholderia aspalathi]|uniref:FRG domain-containing protein n=1 Tax=Paraburkholderia aspalathi TaxID=1324617 RepID=UPI0038BD3F33
MSNPTLIKVSSLAEYVAAISKINAAEEDSAWFRGHSSASHRLLPGVLRNVEPLTSAYGTPLRGNEILRAEGNTVTGIDPERMLDDFKRRALPFLEFTPRNDFEWLFLMQHHGVPTRLLDWTTNALVALYFAVSSLRADAVGLTSETEWDEEREELDEFAENSATVFAMNPSKVNTALHGDIDEVVDVAQNYERWEAYSRPTILSSEHINTYAPLCITAPQLSPRIRAQSGLFSIHGFNVWSLDYYTEVRALLTKILIPFEAAIAVQRELRHFGISESLIYPGLDSVAKDVKTDEERRYAWQRKAYLEKLDSISTDTKRNLRSKKRKSGRIGKKAKSK